MRPYPITESEKREAERLQAGVITLGVSRGGHLCHFYETKADLLDTLLPFLRAGLDNREFCLWLISDLISYDEAVTALSKTVPDIQQRLSAGDIEIVSDRDCYFPDGSFNVSSLLDRWKLKLKNASAKGYAGVRISGDASWAFNNCLKDFAEYEKSINQSIGGLNLTALCTYALGNCKASHVLDVVGTHQVALTQSKGQVDVIEASAYKMRAEIEQMKAELETRVLNRTIELANANEELLKEIAERKRAEKELRKREAQLRDAQSLAHIGSWEWDLGTGSVNWSDEFYRIWGVSKEEFVPSYDAVRLLVHPADRDELISLIDSALRDKSGFTCEHRIRWPDGTTRILQSRGTVVVNDEGEVVKLFGTGQDVTERRQAEAELRDSETLRRMVIESEPECVKLVSRDCIVLEMNPAGLAMVEADSREQVIGRSVLDMVVEGSREAYRQLNERVFRGETAVAEFEIVGLKGTRRWMETHAAPLLDKESKVTAQLAITRDITEQKRAEEASRKAELKYRNIFENSGEGIFQTTPDGRFLTANPALARMFGFDSPQELVEGRTDIENQHYVDPARRQELKQLLEENESMQGFEYQAYRKDGTPMCITTNVRAVRNEQGELLYYEGVAQDITERRRAEDALSEAEQKYRELFENAKDVIYVHDLYGRYTSVNRAAEALSGYSREEILGKFFTDMVAPEYLAEVRTHLCSKLASEGETSYEIEIIGKDGRRIPVEVSSRLIRKNGVAIGVQGIARDITERKLAEETLRRYSRRLMEAQEDERQRIARELHDQIGQILTAVQFNLHTVQRLCPTSDAAAHVDDGIRVLDEALEQVRDLSLDLRPSLLDDLGLVPALRWYAGRHARRTGLRPEVSADLPFPDARFARDVETACFRIAQEALTNVARHARASQVSVVLRIEQDNLRLVINDNGAGFDAAALRKRDLSAATLGFQGMQERAQAVGGSFWVASAPSKGTQVNASFPIKNGTKPIKEAAAQF
ncbi:MAG TPA: PAS domain S-box protein [Pyrinomonadaceae bacterium]|nr:PAS domain S-box protein [Pyrinomonadaceae bacterium]